MITKTELYTEKTEEEVRVAIAGNESNAWSVRQIVAFEAGITGPGARRSQRPARGQSTLAFFVVYEKEA